MNQSIQLTPVASLPSIIGKGKLVAFNVGPDRVVYCVLATRPLDDRIKQPGWASFVKTVPDQPQRYRVVGFYDGEVVKDVLIENEPFNIHEIQPLDDKLLLVCARSTYRSRDDYEKNGRIYTQDGKFVGAILLGDGIASVQATSECVIWTSYFDEGVFGNYGWNSPVGQMGLVAWDSKGEKTWEFQPGTGLEPIYDCYALNVASAKDVWFYYYDEFPLVWLQNRKVNGVWKMPLSGSPAFAVFDGYALFSGGYKDRETFHLFRLEKSGGVKSIADFKLHDKKGQPLLADRIVGRENTIYMVHEGDLYQIDVETALAHVGNE